MLKSPETGALDRLECLRLLATQSIGRVVYTFRGLPAVQPVRFRLDNDIVYFIKGIGSPLAACHDEVVAFEVDGFDAESLNGWYVTVVGRAGRVGEDGAPYGRLVLPLRGWRDDNNVYMRIGIEVTTGLRLSC